ncbi:1034_t:CDS:1, partial [Dentiscutata erythropus]
ELRKTAVAGVISVSTVDLEMYLAKYNAIISHELRIVKSYDLWN